MRKKNFLTLFILLSCINLIIFLRRENFTYRSYASYSSLYKADPLKWKKYVTDFPKEDLVRAAAILDSSIKINGVSTKDKLLQIGKWLYDRFHKQAGRPSAEILDVAPLDKFKMLSSSDSAKVWCGVYANMFAFFCWSKGIACRVIESMNPGDHHVVNECYLPETNEWVMVDVTYNRLLILDTQERKFLNLLNVRESLSRPMLGLQSANGSIDTVQLDPSLYKTYFKKDNPLYFYYRVNNYEVYKTGEKFKRYFLPVSWYQVIDEMNERSNILFYVKITLLILWLVIGIRLLIYLKK